MSGDDSLSPSKTVTMRELAAEAIAIIDRCAHGYAALACNAHAEAAWGHAQRLQRAFDSLTDETKSDEEPEVIELLITARACLPDPDFVPTEDEEVRLRAIRDRIDKFMTTRSSEKATTEYYTQEALDAAHARTRERLSKLKVDDGSSENGSVRR